MPAGKWSLDWIGCWDMIEIGYIRVCCAKCGNHPCSAVKKEVAVVLFAEKISGISSCMIYGMIGVFVLVVFHWVIHWCVLGCCCTIVSDVGLVDVIVSTLKTGCSTLGGSHSLLIRILDRNFVPLTSCWQFILMFCYSHFIQKLYWNLFGLIQWWFHRSLNICRVKLCFTQD